MASQTEQPATGEFIVSEANGTRSRENIVVVSGTGVVPAGRIMGKITVGGKYANMATGAGNGAETAAGILYGQVDATSADAIGVIICRDAEVVASRIGAANPAHKAAALTQLATIGIYAR